MRKKINEKLSGLQNMGKGSHISSGLADHLSSCHVIFLNISQQAQTSIEVGSLKSYLFELHGKPYDK